MGVLVGGGSPSVADTTSQEVEECPYQGTSNSCVRGSHSTRELHDPWGPPKDFRESSGRGRPLFVVDPRVLWVLVPDGTGRDPRKEPETWKPRGDRCPL